MYKKAPVRQKTEALCSLANTKKIMLFMVEKLSDGIGFFYDVYNFRSAFMNGGPEYVEAVKQGLEIKQIQRALIQLRRKRFIAIRRRGETIVYSLTNKGFLAGLKEQIKIADRSKDGLVCLVSFDVPEQERLVRLQVRRFLKDCGFAKRQQSLWVSEKNVGRLVSTAIQRMNAESWLHVYDAVKIN